MAKNLGLNQADVLAAYAAAGNSVTRAAAALGVSDRTVRYHVRRAGCPPPPVIGEPKRAGRPLSDFAALHDKSFIVPQRIRAGLTALGNGWEYEAAFAKLCEVSLPDLNTYREQFADFFVVIGRTGKKAWAGTKEAAAKMRSMVP